MIAGFAGLFGESAHPALYWVQFLAILLVGFVVAVEVKHATSALSSAVAVSSPEVDLVGGLDELVVTAETAASSDELEDLD